MCCQIYTHREHMHTSINFYNRYIFYVRILVKVNYYKRLISSVGKLNQFFEKKNLSPLTTFPQYMKAWYGYVPVNEYHWMCVLNKKLGVVIAPMILYFNTIFHKYHGYIHELYTVTTHEAVHLKVNKLTTELVMYNICRDCSTR